MTSQEVVPGVYNSFVLSRGPALLPLERLVLVIGWRLSSIGSENDHILVPLTSVQDAEALAGVGSQLALMAAACFASGVLARKDREVGSPPTLVACAVPPPTGVAATQTLTVSGTASAPWQISGFAGNEPIVIAGPAGDTAAIAAAALDEAIQGVIRRLPFTTSLLSNVITWTAREPGLWGEDLVLAFDTREAPGLSIAVARGVSGTGLADVTAALDTALLDDFSVVCVPQDDSSTLTAVSAFIDESWSTDHQRYSVVVCAGRGTIADATTTAATLDDWRIVLSHGEQIAGTGGTPFNANESARSFAFEIAAAVGARLCTHTRPNHNYNKASLPVHGRPEPNRAVLRDALTSGICEIVTSKDGTGRFTDPRTTAITDQVENTGLSDFTFSPVEIPLTAQEVARRVDIVLDRFTEASPPTGTYDDQSISVKAALFALLNAQASEGRISAPVEDDIAITTSVSITGATLISGAMKYSVRVGTDVIEIQHQISRSF